MFRATMPFTSMSSKVALRQALFSLKANSVCTARKIIIATLFVVLIFVIHMRRTAPRQIIFITPTSQRPERLADLTMLAQTLRQVRNIHWILVEDANSTNILVQDLLNRYKIKSTYLHAQNNGLPCRGWAQRNFAVKYLKDNRDKFAKDAVVYFGDDDNSYDLRLFDAHIRKVDYMGVWAVGLPGNALVEHPLVNNGRFVGWHSAYRPERNFATDMAGFALNIDLLVNSNATFNLHCAGTMPEDCFLTQMKIDRRRIKPFGWEGEFREILIWHRKTAPSPSEPFPTNGYLVESRRPDMPHCNMLRHINEMTYPQVKLVVDEYAKIPSQKLK